MACALQMATHVHAPVATCIPPYMHNRSLSHHQNGTAQAVPAADPESVHTPSAPSDGPRRGTRTRTKTDFMRATEDWELYPCKRYREMKYGRDPLYHDDLPAGKPPTSSGAGGSVDFMLNFLHRGKAARPVQKKHKRATVPRTATGHRQSHKRQLAADTKAALAQIYALRQNMQHAKADALLDNLMESAVTFGLANKSARPSDDAVRKSSKQMEDMVLASGGLLHMGRTVEHFLNRPANHIATQNGASSGFDMCFAPSTPSARGPNPNTSII